MLAGAVQLHEVLLLRRGELGLAAAELAGRLGDRHALAGAGTNQVGLELGDRAEDVKEEPADWVRGVVNRSSEIERDPLRRELICDLVASRSDRARRSSLVTTNTSLARQAASALRRPGRARVVPDKPWSTCT